MTETQSPTTTDPTPERADLLAALTQQRWLFRHTLQGLTDEQAAARTTVSELCLGGLVKHVTVTEAQWADFVQRGPVAFTPVEETDWQARADSFRLLPDESVEQVLADYAAVARRTDELIATADLDAGQPLPPAPWFEPGAVWSARRVFVHVALETAQHAGHADLLREAIDGQKTMG